MKTKREDLEAREFGLIIASSNFPFYTAPEADAVMDAMEARIKELEKTKNGILTRNVELIGENAQLTMTIKELEEQCTKYQAELMNNDPALNPAISKMETTQKWISVEDKLPKEGEEVIVFYTCWKHEYQQVAIFESGEFIDLGGCALSPTHWMPLPPPPTTEEK